MPKNKFSYRTRRCRGAWRVWVQVKPRGRWLILRDEESDEYAFEDQEQAILFCFLQEMGPRYERWFRMSYITAK